MRVADYLAKYLVEHDIKNIFLVSGGGIMHLLDGVKCNPDLSYVCCHNEAAGAIMAEGYARVSGRPGVIMVTTGPGATNAVTGAVDAWIDSIPMIVISGQTKRSQNVQNYGIEGLRQIGGQEVDILPIVRSFCKYAEMINDPEKIKYHLDRAFYDAKGGRPGPSWLDIPLDVQAAEIDEDRLVGYLPEDLKLNDDQVREVKEVRELLRHSQRPVFVVGNGVFQANAVQDMRRIVEMTHIPVVASKQGQDVIPNDRSSFIGIGGTRGNRAANLAMQNSDLLIAIGSRLSNPFIGYEAPLFAREAKKVVVDIDPRELKKFKFHVDVPINADAKLFIHELISLLEEESYTAGQEWTDTCKRWKVRFDIRNEPNLAHRGKLSIYEFFGALSDSLPNHSIVIGDAGSTYYVVSQGTTIKEGQRILVPAGLGSMGLSLPLGIGAQYADPDALVAAVCGEGSLQMNIQEFQTLFHYKIPVKLFVVNNGGYFSIKNTQEVYFNGRYCGSEPSSGVSFPDLKNVSKAYKLPYKAIKSKTRLKEKIVEVLASDGPFVCEVFTDPGEKIRPSVMSKIMNGQMVSAPLEDMFPYLSREELKKEMIVKLVEEPTNDN